VLPGLLLEYGQVCQIRRFWIYFSKLKMNSILAFVILLTPQPPLELYLVAKIDSADHVLDNSLLSIARWVTRMVTIFGLEVGEASSTTQVCKRMAYGGTISSLNSCHEIATSPQMDKRRMMRIS
jgi:hypothetical protein